MDVKLKILAMIILPYVVFDIFFPLLLFDVKRYHLTGYLCEHNSYAFSLKVSFLNVCENGTYGF